MLVLGIFFLLPSLLDRAGVHLPIADWFILFPARLLATLLFYATGHQIS
jgi:hypothetical protein